MREVMHEHLRDAKVWAGVTMVAAFCALVWVAVVYAVGQLL